MRTDHNHTHPHSLDGVLAIFSRSVRVGIEANRMASFIRHAKGELRFFRTEETP